MKVFVYWNLHKGLWSIKSLEGDNKGRVIARLAEVYLQNCELKVSEVGRQRVLSERRKNVHAGVVGELVDPFENEEFIQITYNPYKYSSFVQRESLEPVYKAMKAKLNEDRSVQIKI